MTMTDTCPVCGNSFIYMDMRHKPTNCGKPLCRSNQKFQRRRFDPYADSKPSYESIKKWR